MGRGRSIPAWQPLQHRQGPLRLFAGKNTFFYHHIVRDMVPDMQLFLLLPDQHGHIPGAVSLIDSQPEQEPLHARPALQHPHQVAGISARMVEDEQYPLFDDLQFSVQFTHFTIPLLSRSLQRTNNFLVIFLPDSLRTLWRRMGDCSVCPEGE